MHTVAFCEIDPYCRAVLRKHWPEVPIFSDVRDLHAFDVGPVDVICGGFPCQDISGANPGGGLGLNGERSGLWFEYRRLVEEIRPPWVIVENVSVLRTRGLEVVLQGLNALGYCAEWHCIPASAVGAPHQRDRIWIAAHRHANGDGEPGLPIHAEAPRHSGDAADADCPRLPLRELLAGIQGEAGCRAEGQDAALGGTGWWLVEPSVGRVADGVPRRVDRLRALGNAVVPQIPELIGRAIMNTRHKGRSGDSQ